jgi:hypothetical protein
MMSHCTLHCKVDLDMNDLDKALGDISSIRRQVAGSTEFRGYGPATLAATGGFAVCAAAIQQHWLTSALAHPSAYLAIWITTAIVSVSLAAVQMYTRTRRIHSGFSHEMLRMAVAQFLPAAGAGFLLTFVIARYAPSVVWMLPGLWQISFSLGIFSSCRFLPRMMMMAGGWYLLTGLVSIAMGSAYALSPWAMGLSFGAGQLLIAGILYFYSGDEADE